MPCLLALRFDVLLSSKAHQSFTMFVDRMYFFRLREKKNRKIELFVENLSFGVEDLKLHNLHTFMWLLYVLL